MKNIRTVLVDEFELIKCTMEKVLVQFPHIEIIDGANNFNEARFLIKKLQPDLVVLNKVENVFSYFDLIKDLKCNPKIIYISANDNTTLNAFELKTVDHIVKPIIVKSVDDVIEKITKPMDEFTKGNLHGNKTFQTDQIILLKFDNKMNFIKIKNINYIEAYGNYTKVNMDDSKLSITHNSIKNWLSKLPENNFIKIHRSTIVNLMNIQKIEKWNNNTGRLYLKGSSIPFEISRSYFLQIKKKYKI